MVNQPKKTKDKAQGKRTAKGKRKEDEKTHSPKTQRVKFVPPHIPSNHAEMQEAVILTRQWLEKAHAFANGVPGKRGLAPHFEPLFKDLRKYTPDHQGKGWRQVKLYFDGHARQR